jgi:hypothetical protein
MEPFNVLVRDGSHIFREKNPSGITGNGVSTSCTPRYGARRVALPRFLRSFLNFYFPESCCIRFQKLPGSSLGSMLFIFEVGV